MSNDHATSLTVAIINLSDKKSIVQPSRPRLLDDVQFSTYRGCWLLFIKLLFFEVYEHTAGVHVLVLLLQSVAGHSYEI
jgi:hypothetical protein